MRVIVAVSAGTDDPTRATLGMLAAKVALDIIAERIRAPGHPAPGTYKDLVKLASIKEVEGVPSSNAAHGFEGELNEKHQRSAATGWRHDDLPWEQC